MKSLYCITGEIFLTDCVSNRREILLTCVLPERSVFTTGSSDLILQPTVHVQLYTSELGLNVQFKKVKRYDRGI